MLLIIRMITAICRGRIEALVTVRRSRNRHIETLVNVSVANVFLSQLSKAQYVKTKRLTCSHSPYTYFENS